MMQMTQEQRIKIIDFLMVFIILVAASVFTTSVLNLNFVLPDIGTITSLMVDNPIKIIMSFLVVAATLSDRCLAYAVAFKQYMQNLVMPVENIAESGLIDSSTNTNNNNITTTLAIPEITNQNTYVTPTPVVRTEQANQGSDNTEQPPRIEEPQNNDNQRRPFDNIAKIIAICSSATIGGVFYRYRNELLSTIDRYFNNHIDENTKQKETQTSKPKP